MDKAQIRKALDSFENDKYVDAREIIAKEIAGKRDVFIKDKLGLATDVNPQNNNNDQDDLDGDNE